MFNFCEEELASHFASIGRVGPFWQVHDNHPILSSPKLGVLARLQDLTLRHRAGVDIE